MKATKEAEEPAAEATNTAETKKLGEIRGEIEGLE